MNPRPHGPDPRWEIVYRRLQGSSLSRSCVTVVRASLLSVCQSVTPGVHANGGAEPHGGSCPAPSTTLKVASQPFAASSRRQPRRLQRLGATRSPKTILRDGGKAAKVAGEFDEQRTSRPPRTLTTVYPRWCDDSTSRAKHQFQPPQVSGCEHRPTAGDWSSATKGCTMSEARTKRR